MDSTLALVAVIIVIALIFDFTNGFHDAANSIATVVSTRVLSPGRAVLLAAFFNFVAFFLVTHAVAKTVSSGLIDPKQVNEWVVLAGLIGAVTWNLITWYLGLADQFLARADRRIRRRRNIERRISGAGLRREMAERVAGHDFVHRHLADRRNVRRVVADDRGLLDFPPRRAVARGQRLSASCNWFHRRSSASRTARTTLRKRWESSWPRWSPADI